MFHHFQVLIDVVETFAKKHDCLILVTGEYRRRLACDDDGTESYRQKSDISKSIFAVHIKNEIIYVYKYYSIADRWELFCNVKVTRLNDSKFGVVFAGNEIFLIGGYSGESLNSVTREVCCISSEQLNFSLPFETTSTFLRSIRLA